MNGMLKKKGTSISGDVEEPGEERLPVRASSEMNELFLEPKKMIDESSDRLAHTMKERSTVRTRNIHGNRVLVDNVID